MVIFSIVLLIVVLFYQRGIMGKNEFSWDKIGKNIVKLKGLFNRNASKKGGSKNV
jgi:branched-chain amino acid transport system permease protein